MRDGFLRAAWWTGGAGMCMLVFAAAAAGQSKTSAKKAPQPPAATKAAANQPSTLNGVYTAEQAERGRQFYLGNCKSCHAPESHTGPTFAKWWKGKKLSDLFTFISTQMPKNDPGSLDSGDVADVMAYLLKMNQQPVGKDELYPDADSLSKFRIDVKGTTKGVPSTAKGKKP